MQTRERVPSGGTVKGAKRDRRNFAVREAEQSKIARTHPLTGTPGALGFASAKDANLAGAKPECKKAVADTIRRPRSMFAVVLLGESLDEMCSQPPTSGMKVSLGRHEKRNNSKKGISTSHLFESYHISSIMTD